MSETSEHESHGHSIAAWTAVGILLVAFAIMALAVTFLSTFWFVVSWVLVVVGAAAGKLLSMAGFGEETQPRDTQQSSGVS